jgi:iron(III) transport system substrate-binding protein
MSMIRIAATALTACVLMQPAAQAAEAVNVYTSREQKLVEPLFAKFTKETGIAVNVIFASQGLERRIQTEGAASPADILLTVDIGRLVEAVDLGITQPITSPEIEAAVPAQYRDPAGNWVGLSARSRVVYVAKDKVPASGITYEDLADPKYRGKVCIRSGQNIYNIGLFSHVTARLGEAAAEEWLKGVKANLAQKPSGGDREVARDIASGKCEIGIANTYYWALMATTEAERKPWADATTVVLPTFRNGGTHMNVSGAVLARHAPNKDNALKLITWLTSPEAQQIYAAVNYEFPVRAGVPLHPVVAGFGPLKADALPLAEIAKNRKIASQLVDKVGFDN